MVELGDDQDAAGTARSEGLADAWPGASRAREPVGNMHVLIVNIECF